MNFNTEQSNNITTQNDSLFDIVGEVVGEVVGGGVGIAVGEFLNPVGGGAIGGYIGEELGKDVGRWIGDKLEEVVYKHGDRLLDLGTELLVYTLNRGNVNNGKDIMDYLKEQKPIYSYWEYNDSTLYHIWTRLIPHYGLFGGPNYSYGKANLTQGTYFLSDFQMVAPENEQDELYATHDLIYSLKDLPHNEYIGDKILLNDAIKLASTDEWKDDEYLHLMIMAFKIKMKQYEIAHGYVNLPNIELLKLSLPDYKRFTKLCNEKPDNFNNNDMIWKIEKSYL